MMLPFIERDHQGSCPERPDDGGDTFHCRHLCLDGPEPKMICCHCGDISLLILDTEPQEHGEYATGAKPEVCPHCQRGFDLPGDGERCDCEHHVECCPFLRAMADGS